MLLEVVTENLCTILVTATLFLLAWIFTWRPSSFPPGPPRVPFLGNIFSLRGDPRRVFSRLRRQYGNIYSIYIFNKPVIVLSGYDVLKEALVKRADDFSDRPASFLTDHMANGRGIVFNSGQLWHENRSFAMKTLKDLGMGTSAIEKQILEELSFLLQHLQHQEGSEIDCSSSLLHNVVYNVISVVAFGKRLEYDDPTFIQFHQILEENITNLNSANILNVLPAVRFVPGDPFKYKKTLQNIRTIENELVYSIVKSRLDGNNVDTDDFTNAYIKEMERRQQQGGKTTFDVPNLKMCLTDLLVAGTETTGTVFRWALVYLLNYPDVQEKCFQEIKENIGLNRPPSMKDKSSLPFLDATINEVLRCADAVPGNLPHSVPADTQFRGYTFPKGVTIVPLLTSVLQDPDVWGDPENFRPERFLTDSGRFQRREETIPFSIGRRECLGESLARMELFLILAGLVQNFQLLPSRDGLPSLVSLPGLINRAAPFRMNIVSRLK